MRSRAPDDAVGDSLSRDRIAIVGHSMGGYTKSLPRSHVGPRSPLPPPQIPPNQLSPEFSQ